MSDAQIQQEQEAGTRLENECLLAWSANLNIGALNLQALPRVQTLADPVAPTFSTAHDAAAHADIIVVATVSSLAMERDTTAMVVKLSTEQTVKGAPGATQLVQQGGTLQPASLNNYSNTHDVVIAEDPTEPFLIPGQTAILFLNYAQNPHQSEAALDSEPWTGTYLVAGGKISATPGNPFASQVDGMTVNEFLSSLG